MCARQNVVFENGYLIAKIGRGRVCALIKDDKDIELPSDILGVLYKTMDNAGAWKTEIEKEMKAAGLCINPTF